jgi:hypothetical protein
LRREYLTLSEQNNRFPGVGKRCNGRCGTILLI